MKVRLTLTEQALGMTPAVEDIHKQYIASQAPDAAKMEEEIAERGVDAIDQETTTIFPRLEDGTPYLWNYQIKGFLKDACQMLARAGKSGYKGGKACAALKAYKKYIDGCLFVEPRKIPFDMHGGEMSTIARSLRAATPQGERISLAKSETVPVGSTLDIEFNLLDEGLKDMVLECLEYGKLRGLCQWRNASMGTFTYEILEE